MRIGIVSWRGIGHPAWGGCEVLVDRVACGLAERGWDVTLMCARPAEPRPYRIIENGGRFTQYLTAPWRGRRLRDVDVLIDVANGIPFFSPLWRRRPIVCLVCHVHERQWRTMFPTPVASIGWFLESRIVPRLYRRYWSISPSTSGGLQRLGVGRDAIHEIVAGIDVDEHPDEQRRSGEPTFVVVSRLLPNKGVDRVLDAWERVRPVVGGELIVVGDGPLRGELEGRGTPSVRFLGHVDETTKRDVLRRAWVLVHGAHHEGWGIVVMEAAAFGVPTVAFDADGIRDVVVDGVTGLLGRDLDEVVDHWIDLARSEERRDEFGRKAWERATNLSWDLCVDRVAAMLQQVAVDR